MDSSSRSGSRGHRLEVKMALGPDQRGDEHRWMPRWPRVGIEGASCHMPRSTKGCPGRRRAGGRAGAGCVQSAPTAFSRASPRRLPGVSSACPIVHFQDIHSSIRLHVDTQMHQMHMGYICHICQHASYAGHRPACACSDALVPGHAHRARTVQTPAPPFSSRHIVALHHPGLQRCPSHQPCPLTPAPPQDTRGPALHNACAIVVSEHLSRACVSGRFRATGLHAHSGSTPHAIDI